MAILRMMSVNYLNAEMNCDLYAVWRDGKRNDQNILIRTASSAKKYANRTHQFCEKKGSHFEKSILATIFMQEYSSLSWERLLRDKLFGDN